MKNPAHLAGTSESALTDALDNVEHTVRSEEAEWFKLIKGAIVPDKTPPRFVSLKRGIAFTTCRDRPETVDIEMPYPGRMLRITIKIPGWRWYDYDALRWLIPDDMPEDIVVKGAHYDLDGRPPSHSETFEQYIDEAIYAAPGGNLHLDGGRGDMRVAGTFRYARDLIEEAVRTGDFELHQLEEALEEYNRLCNIPGLSAEQMSSISVAAIGDVRDDQ